MRSAARIPLGEVISAAVGAPPNPRVQRTRSSASPRSSPLTRHPLGRAFAIALVLCGRLVVAEAQESQTTTPQVKADFGPPGPQGCSFTIGEIYTTRVGTQDGPAFPVVASPRAPRDASDGCTRTSGEVLISFLVTAQGTVQMPRILQSSGCKKADRRVLDAVRSWAYIPAYRAEKPAASAVVVLVPLEAR
jgi:TonB family protein